jgi:hypothetical protein
MKMSFGIAVMTSTTSDESIGFLDQVGTLSPQSQWTMKD